MNKKYIVMFVLMFCVPVSFISGFLFGKITSSDKCNYSSIQNIEIGAVSLVKELKINEIVFDDDMVTVTINSTINSAFDQLINKEIIKTSYNVPVSANIWTNNGEQITLISKEPEIVLDLSKDSIFELVFMFENSNTIYNDLEKIQSVNVSFELGLDSSNSHTHIASYVCQNVK